MQKVESHQPLRESLRFAGLFVSPVGKCVCIGVDPLWTDDERTIESLPKGAHLQAFREAAKPLTFCMCPEGDSSSYPTRNLAPPRILSARHQLRRRGLRPTSFAAQLPVAP
jgi:hypothetical protein